MGDSWEAADPAAEAKHILQELTHLSELHPNFERHLQSAIKALRWEARRTSRSDQDAVLKALEEGCASPKEIAEETHLSMTEIRPILIKFIETGLVERRRRGGPEVRGCGGIARQAKTEMLYFLSHTPAGSNISVGRKGQSSFTAFADSVREMHKT
jgi:hypothetical protein